MQKWSHWAILVCLTFPVCAQRIDLGRLEPNAKMPYITVSILPTAAQQSALDRLLADQQNRLSPNYHHWLTPEEFADRFGTSPADYSKVVAWLQSQGLHIENTARARNWVAFSGRTREVETAFHTEIHRYLLDSQVHFGNATAPDMPPMLSSRTTSVRGLDDFWKTMPPPPRYTASNGVNQLAPDDWATIYDVLPLYKMGIDGTGQRIAIIGRSSTSQSYIDSFRKMFGLPPSQIEMHLIGPDPGVTNASGEAALDLEWSGAIARKATLVYVYANNFNDAAQAAIDQNLAPVMSESFGVCEPDSAVANRAMAQQANAQGITWVAASGDSGGAGCDPHGFFGSTAGLIPASGGPAVNLPAAFPEVTAVGGTEFNEAGGQYWSAINSATNASALGYIPEMVWNETGGGGLLASGGGASTYFGKPVWQSAPGVPDDNVRDVPDISFSASGNHDPYVVINANGQRATGGTSAATPSFAGVLALLNQFQVAKGLPPGLGNINPELYRLARLTSNIFHDITQGNSMVPCTPDSPGCSTGMLGFPAGPGYDQASGLGSADIYNLVTQWGTGSASTVTTLTVNPGSIMLGDPVQVTATVTGQSGTLPRGTITFSSGQTILGETALVLSGSSAMATMTVTGAVLAAGNTTVTATYSGDNFYNGSVGSTVISVAAKSSGSSVTVSITPNPAHEGQFVTVSLTEENGVATTVTGWSINGVDDFSRFATDFGSTTLAAYGTLSSSIGTAVPPVIPNNRVYVFRGVDGDGRPWSQQYTLILLGPQQTPGLSLSGTPGILQPAGSSCQATHELVLQEQNGFAVQLTRFTSGGADWTSQIQQLFGTTRLAPFGMLQAQLCWPGAQSNVAYEIDGVDQIGEPLSATYTASFVAAGSGAISAAPTSVALAAGPSQTATATVALNAAGPWAISVTPANQTTTWLSFSQTSGAGPQTITIRASSAGMNTGVYNATLILLAANSTPPFLEVPVIFTVGASGGTTIGGVSNGASFGPAFAPGMILSVFGTQLAPSVQVASSLPLPLTMRGVSATVNGVPAPLYFVSSGQLNLQVPYETGAGTAVLGVNNNGQVASYLFQVAPSAPGIFTDMSRALVPASSGKPGDILLLFVTGEGDVAPPLATGTTPFIGTPVNLLPQPRSPLTVTVGGIAADVLFAGVPSGVAGVTQVNFVVPKGLSPGVQQVVVTVGGVPSAPSKLNVTQ